MAEAKILRDYARTLLQDAVDELLFLSDEAELGRLPVTDAASALRLAATLFSLQRRLR